MLTFIFKIQSKLQKVAGVVQWLAQFPMAIASWVQILAGASVMKGELSLGAQLLLHIQFSETP